MVAERSYVGRGFEGALTFEVAERLGFSEDEVRFVPIGYAESFAPGDKDFDFALQQIRSLPERAEGVDFSEGYYDVVQALVSVRGSPIANATSLEELRDASLGAPVDSASLNYIEDTIRPSTQPTVYDDLRAAVHDLNEGRVDGIVVDLPSASFIAEAQVPGGVIVGRFPASGSQEHFTMAFEKGSPIVGCVNLAPPGDEGRRHARRDPTGVARGRDRRAAVRGLTPRKTLPSAPRRRGQ